MSFAFARHLSLPAAIGLGVALTLACKSSTPSEPEVAPSFRSNSVIRDDDGFQNCPKKDFELRTATVGSFGDDNGNGYICVKDVGHK